MDEQDERMWHIDRNANKAESLANEFRLRQKLSEDNHNGYDIGGEG